MFKAEIKVLSSLQEGNQMVLMHKINPKFWFDNEVTFKSETRCQANVTSGADMNHQI